MESNFAGTVGVIFVVLAITIAISGNIEMAGVCILIALALFWKSATAKD
jgi:hypothetical protein